MRQINITDPQFHLKLTTALVPVQVVDSEGHCVGRFIPEVTVDDLKAQGVWGTDEEIRLAANQPGPRYTTAEVIAHLRSL